MHLGSILPRAIIKSCGQDHAQGNHNWVEVFVGDPRGEPWADPGTGQSWAFIEALPAGVSACAPFASCFLKKAAAQGGETFTNPCDKWFCSKTRGYGNGTKVFAAGFGHAGHPDVYEMEWEPDNKGVPGVDRTKQYAEWCNKCP